MPLQDQEGHWYAIYTCSRHEKKIVHQLERKAFETFLPTYEIVRRWKNGLHRIELPLFPGYALVRISLHERLEVLKVPGVVRIVGFNGLPIPLAEEEIENMRRVVSSGFRAEPFPYLSMGRRVRITSGPLVGGVGLLVRRKGRSRFVWSVNPILRSVAVDIETSDVEPA